MRGGLCIWGRYRGRSEHLDTAESPLEAERLAAEYRMAFGSEWAIWIQ